MFTSSFEVLNEMIDSRFEYLVSIHLCYFYLEGYSIVVVCFVNILSSVLNKIKINVANPTLYITQYQLYPVVKEVAVTIVVCYHHNGL